MDARPEDTLTDDELAAQAAEPLPDRQVMSVICPPDEGFVAGEWVGGEAETVQAHENQELHTIPPGTDSSESPPEATM